MCRTPCAEVVWKSCYRGCLAASGDGSFCTSEFCTCGLLHFLPESGCPLLLVGVILGISVRNLPIQSQWQCDLTGVCRLSVCHLVIPSPVLWVFNQNHERSSLELPWGGESPDSS
jgi:hypothetical protein